MAVSVIGSAVSNATFQWPLPDTQIVCLTDVILRNVKENLGGHFGLQYDHFGIKHEYNIER